jgi:hypothetical protein
VRTWQEQAPKAVATLQWNFEQTIAISALGGIARELVRTTSPLERTNRELRRKFRQACYFSSRRGAEVAIYLQVQRLHARWTKTSWTHGSFARSGFLLISTLSKGYAIPVFALLTNYTHRCHIPIRPRLTVAEEALAQNKCKRLWTGEG